MIAVIFVGPTISVSDAHAELDATYLPPVSQGDVYRVALQHPQAIGIIDGYFDHIPAVWHKEVLWAMARGIHVFGSASMGALRAAELADFGMEGVGDIFAAFQCGALEDDDEVAVAHASKEGAYSTLSEAMVNIRATVSAAVAAQIIHPKTGDAILAIAKRLFYAERVYPTILEIATREGVSSNQIDAFVAWLPEGRIDQKRADALAMLRLMSERLAAPMAPKQVNFQVENTDFWDQARRLGGEPHGLDAGAGDPAFSARMIEELRLDPEAYTRARQGALLRQMAVNESLRAGMTVTAEALQATSDDFRRERGLLDTAATMRWMEEQHLDSERFAQLMEVEYRLTWIQSLSGVEIAGRMADQLRVNSGYDRLVARTLEKQRALSARGLQTSSFAEVGLNEAEVIAWYFRDCLGMPAIPDVESHALSLDFPDEDAFRHAVLREYLYRHSPDATHSTPE